MTDMSFFEADYAGDFSPRVQHIFQAAAVVVLTVALMFGLAVMNGFSAPWSPIGEANKVEPVAPEFDIPPGYEPAPAAEPDVTGV